jgi:hypothetical protein
MRTHFDESLVRAGLAATMTVVGLSWLAYAGAVHADMATYDELLTAERCIDNNTTGSIEPFEEALIAEGIVNTELDKINLTREMCEEIIDRTPGGSPIARAVAVSNLTQEGQIIKKSMEDAADKDVNGDGRVDAEDERTADAASLAASLAARESVRRATEEGSTDGGGIGELNAEPVAYLQGAAQAQYPDDGGGGGGGGGEDATASATAGEAQATGLPSREEVRTNASAAAREKGADKKAAAAGGQCAATVALTDGILRLIRGYMALDPPAKEMHWRDSDRAQLVVAPETVGSIKVLEQQLDQADGAGKAEAHCLHLGNQMEAYFIPSGDDLVIRPLNKRSKDVQGESATTWSWDISASERGRHPLLLNVTLYAKTQSGGGTTRSIEHNPPLFDDYINVSAAPGEVFTDFLARSWPALVPIFLTVLTAIIIPLVVFRWKRRNQPSAPRDRSSEPDDQRWI